MCRGGSGEEGQKIADDGCTGEAEERKAKRLLVMDVQGRQWRGRPKDC